MSTTHVAKTAAKVKVALPAEVVQMLGPSADEAARELQVLALVELFRRGEVSSGWAAEHLGITKWEFIQLLDAHEVPYLNQSPEELAQDIEAAQAFLQTHQANSTPS